MRSRSLLRAGLVVAVAILTLGACSSGGNQRVKLAPLGPGLSGVGVLPTAASAWPEAGYDARYSSATTATGPRTGAVRWKRDLGGDATPGPVIEVDGSILAATNSGVLHDLDPMTGTDIWTFDGHGSYGTDLSTSAAVLPGGTLLWPGPDDTLYALTQTGRLLWRMKFAAQVLSPAIAGANRVYVADLSGDVAAIEVTKTGHRMVWRLSLGGTDYASPTIGQDGTVYTASDNHLIAVRDLGATGAVLWKFHAKRMVEVSNAVSPDGTVVLGTNHDKQYGIKPDGTVAWSIDIGDNTYTSSIVRPDRTGWFGDNMGRMRIIDTRTGKVRATIAPIGLGKEKVWTTVVADAHDNAYWGTTAGNVYGYTSSGGHLFSLATGSSIDSYPALGRDGTLYVATTSGTLYAIGS